MDKKVTIAFSVSPILKKRILNYCEDQALNFSKKSCQLWEDFLNAVEQENNKKTKGAA